MTSNHPRFNASDSVDVTTGDRRGRVQILMRTRDRIVMLRRALPDVLQQSFEDWHIHLVNDGGDPAPVDALVAEHAPMLRGRLTLQHNPISTEAAASFGPDRLLGAMLDTAVAVSGTEFFIIHDDDDTWDTRFLAETVAFLESPEHVDMVGVVTGNVQVFERVAGDTIVTEETRPGLYAPAVFADLSQLLTRNRVPPIAVLFRASIVSRIGGWNAQLPLQADWDFCLRAALAGEFGVIPEGLANYHQRRASPSEAYSNTIQARKGLDVHDRNNRHLRNAALRSLVQTQPELLGAVQAILHAQEEAVTKLQNGLQRHLQISLGQQTAVATNLTRVMEALVNDQAALVQLLRSGAITAAPRPDASGDGMREELRRLRCEIAELRSELRTPHSAAQSIAAE